MKSFLIAAALTLMAPATLAQEAEGPELVDALVVNARTPGPAWWSVSKGEAKVWVLGVGAPVEASARWDDAAFKRRVKTARRLIFVPASTTKIPNEALRADRAWMDELTDAERARLAEIAKTTSRKVEFYAAFRPNFTGLLIKGDLDARARPRPGKSQDLTAKARGLGATLVPVGGQEAQGIRSGFKPDERDSLTCLRWAMRPRDPVASREQRARAWVRGDVRELLLGPTAYDPCIEAMGATKAAMENGEDLMTKAIAASLDRGEGAVALVTLTPLLRQGGVLDRLRQRGYRVETPAQLDD